MTGGKKGSGFSCTLVGRPMVSNSAINGLGSNSSTLTMVFTSQSPRATKMAAAAVGTPAV